MLEVKVVANRMWTEAFCLGYVWYQLYIILTTYSGFVFNYNDIVSVFTMKFIQIKPIDNEIFERF